MKNIFGKILTIGAAAFVLASCDLDLTPKNAIAYQEGGQLFQTATDVDAFRTGIYASFRACQSGRYTVTEEFQLDNFNAHVDYGNNYGPIHRMDDSFTAGDYDVEAMWASNYSAIKNYNIVIASADNCAEGLEDDAALVKAEAYFFRAYSYIQLARHFGKAYSSSADTDLCVPLVLKYDQNEKPERATVKAVYDQVKLDIDAANEVLKDVPGAVRSNWVTADAVNALYARYYLDVKDNAKAAEYAHKVIDTGTYTLANTVAGLKDVFTNDAGNEAIFQMYASLSELPNSTPEYAYLTANEIPEKFAYQPYYLPTQTFVNSYETGDIRESWFDKDTYPVKVGPNFVYNSIYVFVKNLGNPALVSNGVPNGRNAIKPFLLSEMYLIAAEAQAGTAAGTADLNVLQTFRHATNTEATLANVQAEWNKETVGQGFRLACLKRWGLGFSGRVPQPAAVAATALIAGKDYELKTVAADDFHLCWPVPSYELKINKNLVQNTGYAAK